MIGNGFDLAHGLPTSYKNFLKFCEIINNFFLYQTVNAETANQNAENYFGEYTTIKQRLRKEFSIFVLEPSKTPFEILNKIADKAIQEFYKMICDNIWIKYFFYIEKSNKLQENWIDLEVEIFKVIQYFENTSKDNENSSVKKMKFYLKDANLKKNYPEKNTEILEIDLRRMTRALEIYLTEFVEGIPLEEFHKKSYIEDIAPDYVLSFNYTDTYSRLYDTSNNVEYDYIHGYARYNNTESTNNMVLGISESLPDESKNKDLRFVTFKKYYQRIYKKTGNKWSYVGIYTPDFLIIKRKDGKIHKIIVVETKGEIYAKDPTFKEKKTFMETEFSKQNNTAFGYERFDYLYLEDTLPEKDRMTLTRRKICEFFKED